MLCNYYVRNLKFSQRNKDVLSLIFLSMVSLSKYEQVTQKKKKLYIIFYILKIFSVSNIN